MDVTIDYSRIPSHMQESVREYVERGRPLGSGSFLEFVFANDLVHAFGKADETNRAAMFEYSCFLYAAPLGCWGSLEKVHAWQKAGGLHGVMKKEITDG